MDQPVISISVTPVTGVVSRPYYDLQGTVSVMELMVKAGAVDGFELQYLAEWDTKGPPLDDVSGHRCTAWENSPKYTLDDVVEYIEGLPVLSVHGNRDIGINMCGQGVDEGITKICNALELAQRVGASVCVFHIWDTWKSVIDLTHIKEVLDGITPGYTVTAAVENVPTHVKGVTPFDLVKEFEWITFDIRWAAMYDEFDKFEAVKDKIVNVHLRGELKNGRWVLNKAPFTLDEALVTLEEWGYSGLLTMEPEGGITEGGIDDLVEAMVSLRKRILK
ncbi:MAG: hypothetical protein PVF58_22840 [Candidatus Methanofastidiosia archaeon]|jgi:hypothetical protein